MGEESRGVYIGKYPQSLCKRDCSRRLWGKKLKKGGEESAKEKIVNSKDIAETVVL
jgi:hypothetical protein